MVQKVFDIHGQEHLDTVLSKLSDMFSDIYGGTSTALAGGSTGGIRAGGGNLSAVVNSAGQGNGADTTDDVLATYALPASALNAAGRQVTITALGKLAATANNKRIIFLSLRKQIRASFRQSPPV